MRAKQLGLAVLAGFMGAAFALSVQAQSSFRLERSDSAPLPGPPFSTPGDGAAAPIPVPAPAGACDGPGLPGNAPYNAGASQRRWVDAFSATPSSPTPSFQQDATTVRIHPHHSDRVMDGGITARDLEVLGQHDVAVVVDRSLSMTTRDCPGVSFSLGGWQSALAGLLAPPVGFSGCISRWQFVQSQTMALTKQIEQIFPHGITLVLFSTRCNVFRNVDLRQIPLIFRENGPGGSTNTADAVEIPIEDYLERRQACGGRVKPLVIAVVTDGMPSNFEALRRLLIETTHQLRSPQEIRITFLQIGSERRGFEFLKELDEGLVSEGARFDIVESKMFPEVVKVGLARSLVDAIEGRPTR